MSVYEKKSRGKKAWMVDVTFDHPGGKTERVRKVSPVNTRKGAEAYERQLREAMLDGSHGKAKTAQTYEAFSKRFLEYVEHNKKHSTFLFASIMVRKHLVPQFGAFDLEDITTSRCALYRDALVKSGAKPATTRNILGQLRRSLNLAVKWGCLDKAPTVETVKQTKQKFRFLAFEEEVRFLEAAKREEPEWYAMLLTAAKTGMRIGELCALRWGEVDLKNKRIMVERATYEGHVDTPKSGAREIPMAASVLEALSDRQHPKRLVFCHADGTPFTKGDTRRPLYNVAVAAGLDGGAKGFGWHALRHTFASHLVMRGVSLSAVSKLMGHSSVTVTERYAHLVPGVLRDAVELLDGPSPLAKVK